MMVRLQTFYLIVGKRLLDLTLLALSAPVVGVAAIFVAFFVRVNLGSPVLFRQVRPGKHGLPFTMIKFRTMTDERDTAGSLKPDSERLTSFGRWLRSTSLDELPELLNVWRGDMSLVGPRPLLMRYLPLYNDFQQRRHDVLPGVTGWAQVNGRNAASWENRFAMDVWYVENVSLSVDLKILARTIVKTVSREGVSQPGHSTADYFKGNDPA